MASLRNNHTVRIGFAGPTSFAIARKEVYHAHERHADTAKATVSHEALLTKERHGCQESAGAASLVARNRDCLPPADGPVTPATRYRMFVNGNMEYADADEERVRRWAQSTANNLACQHDFPVVFIKDMKEEWIETIEPDNEYTRPHMAERSTVTELPDVPAAFSAV